MREGWNIHFDYCLALEQSARDVFGENHNRNKIYDADSIESGSGLEVMIHLLRNKYGFEYNENIEKFINKYQFYFNKGCQEIGRDNVYEFITEFDSLYK